MFVFVHFHNNPFCRGDGGRECELFKKLGSFGINFDAYLWKLRELKSTKISDCRKDQGLRATHSQEFNQKEFGVGNWLQGIHGKYKYWLMGRLAQCNLTTF